MLPTALPVTCAHCQSQMVLQGNNYSCQNCGSTISAATIEQAIHGGEGTRIVARKTGFKFISPHKVPLQPFSQSEAAGAIASIRRTGTFAVILGILDTLLVLGIILLLRATNKIYGFENTMFSLAPALLILGSGLKIRQVTVENARVTERVVEATAFLILGFLLINLLFSKHGVYAYPLLPVLLVGALAKSITLTKRLQLHNL